MGRTKKKKRGGTNILTLGLVLIQTGIFIALFISGFSHLCNPSLCPRLVSASLTFGPLLAAYCGCSLLWLFINRKFFLESLAGILICIVPIRTYCPINISCGKNPKGTIKVMSYNVSNFRSEDHTEFKSITNYIKDSQADILCLQETNTYFQDRIKNAFSEWKYQDITLLGSNGLSLYSQFPIIDKCIVRGPDSAHGAIIYRLEKEGDTIVVINSHFVSNAMNEGDKDMYKSIILEPGDKFTKSNVRHLTHKVDKAGVLRARQADKLMPYLHKLKHLPIILCGDFNDSPLSYVHGQFTNILNDSYTRKGIGPGFSYHQSGMYFRIDHILCSSHWGIKKSIVDSSIKSSDHYPIISWLYLDR